jgi:drug/metabolite transporter (DMT)-like permease
MQAQAVQPHHRRIPRFFRTPSTRLGWLATAGSLGAIVLVVAVNLLSEQGPGPPDDSPLWWAVFAVGMLVCMLSSGVVGLIAVVRRHERSWMVIVPCGLVLLVVVAELAQGLAELLS